ncbi:VPS10 domain-containing receptor SorCS1, partial [Geodia barretti]
MLSFSVSLLLACLLAVCPVQRSWGAIIEVPKFHDNPVSFAFDHHPSSSAGAEPSPREWRRQAGQQPHIDGTHQFNDGYQYGTIYYAGGSSQVIVVLSYDEDNGISYRSNLYRSTNYGSTFTNINGQVGSATLFQYFYWSGDTLIFVHSTESKLSYSNDQGATFTTVDLDPPTLVTTTVVYHPTRDGWMLMRDSTRNTLYLIEDYGKILKEVQENVHFYQWGDAAWDDDDRRVYFTTMDPNPNSDIEDETVNLFVSDYPYTGGSSEFDKNLGDHDGFLLVGRYIFAQRTDDGVIGLHASDRRKPFKRAMIPVPDEHRNYLVIRINDVQALVIVEHAGGFYNLYLSDESGVYYSLSLRDLVIDSDYNIDLELIEGLNGTLVANQYTREDTSDLASSIRTVISLDNGGFWEGLLPPDEDVNGDTINCEPPNCSLHLHMDSTNYARLGVYSTESAPGIIVAHGTIGIELSINPDLFISRDGGVTWEQTLARSWGVNLADHGGLMVAAKDYHQEPSMVLKYSCNEGYSWRDFTFSSTDITIYGVVTEPGQHTTIMSFYGGSLDNFKWTIITVDFTNIFSRQCDDQDYYDWRPWDERTESQCLLGSSITIERRKPQICCLNGRDYDREFDYRICDCASEDYEWPPAAVGSSATPG